MGVSLPDFPANCYEMRPGILGNNIPEKSAITNGELGCSLCAEFISTESRPDCHSVSMTVSPEINAVCWFACKFSINLHCDLLVFLIEWYKLHQSRNTSSCETPLWGRWRCETSVLEQNSNKATIFTVHNDLLFFFLIGSFDCSQIDIPPPSNRNAAFSMFCELVTWPRVALWKLINYTTNTLFIPREIKFGTGLQST